MEDTMNVRKEDQLLMTLVHYFVTKENYSPIYVHGVKDEIWLENVDGPYRVIRINSSHIINEEQFKFDQYKIKDILKQIKKKTMSLHVNALNINLNPDSEMFEGLKNIDNIKINEISEFENNKDILDVFPKVKNSVLRDTNGLELIFNVTRDINKKTEEDNKKYEKIFAPKSPVVSYIIMALCAIYYLVSIIVSGQYDIINGPDPSTIAKLGGNARVLLQNYEIYRLISYAFLHASLIHILLNLYSMYIIAPQIEAKFGKIRFVGIYLLSAICGGLLSAVFLKDNVISCGASGAIFGLLGAMVYFGFRFRLYLKDNLIYRILPVVVVNLCLGFAMTGTDNACHVGGLIAGFLSAMALGIPGDEKKGDTINGIILLAIFILFLSYLVFIR